MKYFELVIALLAKSFEFVVILLSKYFEIVIVLLAIGGLCATCYTPPVETHPYCEELKAELSMDMYYEDGYCVIRIPVE